MTSTNKNLYKKAFLVISSISHKSFTFAFKSRYINNNEMFVTKTTHFVIFLAHICNIYQLE